MEPIKFAIVKVIDTDELKDLSKKAANAGYDHGPHELVDRHGIYFYSREEDFDSVFAPVENGLENSVQACYDALVRGSGWRANATSVLVNKSNGVYQFDLELDGQTDIKVVIEIIK